MQGWAWMRSHFCLALQTQANKAWHLHQIKPSTLKTCSKYLECGIKAKWAHLKLVSTKLDKDERGKLKLIKAHWLTFMSISWLSCA